MSKLIFAALLVLGTAATSKFEDALRAQEAGDFELARRLLKQAADAGSPSAAADLAARLSREGKQVEAHQMYLRAAEAGHVVAMYAAAMNFRNARGTSEDPVRYVHWLRRSAERWFGAAMYSLGGAYRDGYGVAKDERLWIAWWKRAADAGEHNAQYFLARFYLEGKHVAKDTNEALRLIRLASATHSGARQHLASFYEHGILVERNVGRAFRMYLDLAERGHRDVIVKVAEMYRAGSGVTADSATAYGWMSLYMERAIGGHLAGRWKAFLETLTDEERAKGETELARLRTTVPLRRW
jgi:TPR repeat protein